MCELDRTHHILATVDYQEGRYAQALRHLPLAAQLVPRWQATSLLLANTVRQLCGEGEALKEFRRSRQLIQKSAGVDAVDQALEKPSRPER